MFLWRHFSKEAKRVGLQQSILERNDIHVHREATIRYGYTIYYTTKQTWKQDP